MKVFISWSGETSRQVATELRKWLPSVIQSLEPYVSTEDIEKGSRWSSEISKELEDTSFGILCITKDNLKAPWLHFEAGALSKSFAKGRVSPFLFHVKRSEIQGPITQFQDTTFDKEDVKKLIDSLNKTGDAQALEKEQLDKTFEVWWPDLEKKLKEIEVPEEEEKEATASSPELDSSSEILEEILGLLRSQQRLLRRREGIPADHPALRDLDTVCSAFDELLSDFEEDGAIPISIIEDLLSKLRSPVNFVLRRSSFRSNRSLLGDPGGLA